MTKPRVCKDCRAEGRDPRKPVLNAPHPGPRCVGHHRKHRKEVSERSAALRREAQYGIGAELYQALLEAQGGGCAICGRKPGKRRLAVDHDHACCPGKTSCGRCARGLLDWSCNKFLHHIGDDPVRAQRLVLYLVNPPARVLVTSAQVR